jgi:hypothetical protein
MAEENYKRKMGFYKITNIGIVGWKKFYMKG